MRTRGFALPTVLFGLLLLASIVIGAWFAAWQALAHSRLADVEAKLRLEASAELAERIAGWDATLDSLHPGNTALGSSVSVSRTGLNTFALVASRSDAVSGASQRLRDFVRLHPVLFKPAAVVIAEVEPTSLLSRIQGSDACAAKPSITTVSVQLLDSNLLQSGWSLASLQTWISGIPTGGDSLPWRWADSDTTLGGGRFTGLFFAAGNVTIRGGTELQGLVVARGSIVFEGLGGAIIGQVAARRIELSPGTPASAASIIYSSCAALAAGRSRAPVRPFPGVPPSDLN